jgi:hypothetical protein
MLSSLPLSLHCSEDGYRKQGQRIRIGTENESTLEAPSDDKR